MVASQPLGGKKKNKKHAEQQINLLTQAQTNNTYPLLDWFIRLCAFPPDTAA